MTRLVESLILCAVIGMNRYVIEKAYTRGHGLEAQGLHRVAQADVFEVGPVIYYVYEGTRWL